MSTSHSRSSQRVWKRINPLIVAVFALLAWPNLAGAQSYTIAPPPFLTAFDNSGNIINGACIWTYVAGTSTTATTYSDSSGTPNTNPIIADSAGRFTAYLTPGSSYKFVYESACTPPSHGSTLRTADNIGAVPTSGTSVDVTGTAGATINTGDVVYFSDGSGSLTTGFIYQADADNTYSSTTAVTVGIATSAISSASTGTVRLAGRVTGLSGLTAGEIYYASATAGALTATPPTNGRCIGKADTTTSLIMPCDTPDVRLPDSDGTHSRVFMNLENQTADGTVAFAGTGFSRPQTPGGRCTLTTATPVTTADVTAATTLYYAPYSAASNPNQITLYDGTAAWVNRTLTEISIAVPATTNTMYDVFVYDNAGTPTLELTAWTNDTTRATALTTQNGAYVKTGATTRLYVCSFRTTGVSGQTEDSFAKRYVWNYYNRVKRGLRRVETTDSWTYSTAAFQQVNASAANQVDLVVGVAEALLSLSAYAWCQNDNAGGGPRSATGIGEDSTTAISGPNILMIGGMSAVADRRFSSSAHLNKYPAVGRHYYTWLEYVTATGTTTWYGDAGDPGTIQTGMTGFIEG